jgi:hypothetical protein
MALNRRTVANAPRSASQARRVRLTLSWISSLRALWPTRRSSLLRRAFGGHVSQRHPGVARLLPHGDGWGRETRIGEVADGNHDPPRTACVFPVDCRAAYWTKVIGQCVAALGCPRPRRRLAGDCDLIAAEERLVAEHGAGAALAGQTVAHGDARWFTVNRKVKLPAATCGVSGGHGFAPRLLIWAVSSLRRGL